MNNAIKDLLNVLDLHQTGEDRFEGPGHGGETQERIYGGQVVAQALAAACRTVEGRAPHSLHAYFLRPGNPDVPVGLEVTRARDGGSFTTRHVSAVQKGAEILSLTASFQKEEPGYDHQWEMPASPDPESLESRVVRRAWLASRVPEGYRAQIERPSALEVREVGPRDVFNPEPVDDAHAVWFRLSEPLDFSAEMHRLVLAYMSDMFLLSSGLRPVGDSFYTGRIMSASLDHALWFHRPVDMNRWHLYTMDSPNVHGSRSFNRGLIYDQDGRLVASTAQEGLQRIRRKPTL